MNKTEDLEGRVVTQLRLHFRFALFRPNCASAVLASLRPLERSRHAALHAGNSRLQGDVVAQTRAVLVVENELCGTTVSRMVMLVHK